MIIIIIIVVVVVIKFRKLTTKLTLRKFSLARKEIATLIRSIHAGTESR